MLFQPVQIFDGLPLPVKKILFSLIAAGLLTTLLMQFLPAEPLRIPVEMPATERAQNRLYTALPRLLTPPMLISTVFHN